MPTPSEDTSLSRPIAIERTSYTSCPPDSASTDEWRSHTSNSSHQHIHHSENLIDQHNELSISNRSSTSIAAGPSPPIAAGRADHEGDEEQQCAKANSIDEESMNLDASSPVTVVSDGEQKENDQAVSPEPDAVPSLNTSPLSTTTTDTFVNIPRVRAGHTSSFLRAGSKFRGTQQSDKQVYKVEVEVKTVDFKESFLCGYLRIEGLTEDHPTLTTYFEGEIIGPKYTFLTRHDSWGATEKTDMQHWARFPAWRPLAKQAKKPDFHYKNCSQRENVFMRWKEYFLVPDHRVREIFGASFEGFYYICFNQLSGTVSGIYFHAKSEKFQQLELKHVEDRGCFAAVEFR